MRRRTRPAVVGLIAATLVLSSSIGTGGLFAHCDALDGPVIEAARRALETNDVTPALIWVSGDHEQEIRDVFAATLEVRRTGERARELADRYFFETLVRVHRAGEGAPYTGLKPAGSVEPAIAAADKALAAGSVDELAEKIARAVREGIRERFSDAARKHGRADDSVEAGREFVEAYVRYVHFVENVHNIVAADAAHAHGEPHRH
jgi:hypothetical protein